MLRDGDASFYAQTGQVAVEAAEGISATLRQIPGEIGKTLQPPIRALFDAVVGQRVDQDIAGVQDHADAEKRVWQGKQAEQLMAASARNALDHIGTPLFVDHVATGLKALDNRAAVQGWSPAAKRAAEQTYVSDIHKRAIDGLTVGDAIAAEHYYALHTPEMTARDRAEVEDSLRAPVLERRGAAVVDAYGASLPRADTGLAASYAPRRTDLPALREHIEQQDLPDDIKAAALADADARAARTERGIEQDQRAARDAAFALTDDLGEDFTSVTQLPPAMRRALDSETLDALTRRAGANLGSEPVAATGETAHRLVALSATDRRAFVNTDLRPYRDLVTPDEYAALIGAQRGWQASPPALSAVMGQRTWEAIGHKSTELGFGPVGRETGVRLDNAVYFRRSGEDDGFQAYNVASAGHTQSGYKKEDYRTPTESRAWLSEIKSPEGKEIPYPDGRPGDEGLTLEGRRKVREDVGYFYSLPEVKAFLDVLSHTEGTEKDGYKTTHFPLGPADNLTTFPKSKVPSGRYQIEYRRWKNHGGEWFSRTDFEPVTQDIIAITALRQGKVISALLSGDLSEAFSRAARIFASIPVSATADHSGFVKGRWKPDNDDPRKGDDGRQPTPVRFKDLPALFATRLNARRKEFAEAKRAWETDRVLPTSFISPFQWRSFGIKGF
ncbi:hypothetical protein [Sphingomonas sp.]|uniref:hypothetical protein n=1 Tax=Sphingomonas sp. TaxID=28214 RepID=UPI003D6CFEA7